MLTSISAVRAISAEFVRTTLRPLIIIVLGLYIALLVLIGYLAQSLSPWWWVFAVPITLIFMVIGVVLLITWLITSRLHPRQLDREERQQVRSFIAKLVRVAETARTPYPVLLFTIAFDTLIHRESRFIKGAIEDSSTLRGDFRELKRLFD